ncbi:Uncharacterised protein [Mycobacterium tuberculosis]|uniref:Uncharacterized protein n=1 Tax=Mycobacterium tuberculosis TaxID=1773 RepID=A0A0U0QN39_MYCTX|nr:Uncharacterised protein [Mycobacterium tuberculosis]
MTSSPRRINSEVISLVPSTTPVRVSASRHPGILKWAWSPRDRTILPRSQSSAASNGASTKPSVLWLPTSNARSVGTFSIP